MLSSFIPLRTVTTNGADDFLTDTGEISVVVTEVNDDQPVATDIDLGNILEEGQLIIKGAI
ncbi:hypothetical protein O9993_18075 [Vibrio lentus]|nr:hypothetical protein [Vibrio lentus]